MHQLELELQIAGTDRWMTPSIWGWMLIERGWESWATTGLSALPRMSPVDTGDFPYRL